MPVFDDPAVLRAIQVEGLEVDRLAFALDVLELAREMAAKVQMNGGAIAGDESTSPWVWYAQRSSPFALKPSKKRK